jgi:MFS transporter, OPA family, sugar phosphate sensor protein UhpC
MWLLDFFKTGPDKPVLQDANEVRRIYEKKRRSVFFGLVFGYSFFYVCRLSLAIAKKPMIDEGVIDAVQMGIIGSVFSFVYAFGKLTNGFLADRSNVGRFMSMGLLVSAIILLIFGFTNSFLVFVALWAVNGWFQAMGSSPSGSSLSQWFSNKERGFRYSIWSMAHPIGEGVSMVFTAVIVSYLSWRWGFWVAGTVSVLVALLMFKMLADRPRAYGLPAIADYKNDHAVETDAAAASVNSAQYEVIRNPYVWILGLASASMYIARYGVNSWGPMYLQESKDYTLITAGLVFGWAKTMEMTGVFLSGFISDYFFHSRRNVATLMYGLIMTTGLVVLYLGPSTRVCNLDLDFAKQIQEGPVAENTRAAFAEKNIVLPSYAHIESYPQKEATKKTEAEGPGKKIWLVKNDRWYMFWTGYCIEEKPTQLKVTVKYHPAHLAGIALFGFGLGGMVVFLGGLIAIDICSKRASGAAMGLVGVFSYLGVTVQELVSGKLLELGKVSVDGQTIHDFSYAYLFWFCATILAVLLSLTMWKVKQKD